MALYDQVWTYINTGTVFQLGIFPRALRPVRTFFLQNVTAVFVFSDSRCKNACKMLADLCACFHQFPTKLYPDLVSFACWIVMKFWSFMRKCASLDHSRSKLCPNFGCSRARLCPISFAPCLFPNLVGTLWYTWQWHHIKPYALWHWLPPHLHLPSLK